MGYMSDEVAKQLVKQLKRLNFWVTTFGVLFLVGLAVAIYLLVQVFLFAKHIGDSVQTFQANTVEKLDVKQQVCSGTGAFSELVKNNTKACQ